MSLIKKIKDKLGIIDDSSWGLEVKKKEIPIQNTEKEYRKAKTIIQNKNNQQEDDISKIDNDFDLSSWEDRLQEGQVTYIPGHGIAIKHDGHLIVLRA